MSVPILSSYTLLGQLHTLPQRPLSAQPLHIVVITVNGDTHYWGNYFIVILLQNSGYRVTCRPQCAPEQLLNICQSDTPNALIITSLLTTGRPVIEDLIRTIPVHSTPFPIILGGFGLDSTWITTSLSPHFSNAFHYAKEASQVLEILSK